MKQKLKNYLKLGILLFGISITVFSCLKDELHQETSKQAKRNFDFVGYKLPTDSIFKYNANLRKHIAKKFSTKPNVLSRTITSADLGFSIDTTYVQIIKSPTFESFTFIVERDEVTEGILENYVITYFNDGNYSQMLTTYPIIENDGDITYDIANGTAEIITDDSLLMRAGTVDCVVPMEEWQPGDCYEVNCSGETGDGTHGVGDDRCLAQGSDRAYTYCSAGGWVTTGCVYYGTGGGSTTGDGTGTGGNSNNNPPDDEEEEPEDVPVVPFGNKAECKKVNNFLNHPDNAAFKQALNDLANPANYGQNLDIQFEKYVAQHENESILQTKEGDDDKANADISYTLTHPNKVTVFVHTHPNDTVGTYSVFSFDDLKAISNILANDKLDTGTFVAFLITKKGDKVTKYALTINDKTKFKDFFYYENDTNFNILTATQEQKDKRTNSEKRERELRIKYYDHETNPRINNFNVNSEQMLIEFLKFLKEADMGVTMFEAAPTLDGTINNYNTVVLNGNAVERRPCNN